MNKISLYAVLLCIPVFVWGQPLTVVDIDEIVLCTNSTIACQRDIQSTRILVQELLEQIIAAQLLLGDTAQPYRSAQDEYFNQFLEQPLAPGRSRRHNINNGVVSNFNANTHPVYQEIWSIFSTIVPVEYMKNFDTIVFINDPDQFFAAQVQQQVHKKGSRTREEWVLEINLSKVRLDSKKEYNETVITLAHETGHVLALNASQVRFFSNKNDCRRLYLDYIESCAQRGSYFDVFAEYWDDHTDWFASVQRDIGVLDQQSQQKLQQYYRTHSDEFVSRYATVSVHEDLAETMAEFAVNDAPIGTSLIKDKKVHALYDFPEMVHFKRQVQSVLR